MQLSVDALAIEQKIYNYAHNLGKEAALRLAEKLSVFIKQEIPTLSAYGQQNRQEVPHEYKAKPNEIKNSTTVVESKKYDDSYLVNIRDWRAHFMEFPTSPHNRKPRHATAMKFMKKSGMIYNSSKPLHHPGTRGANIFQKANDKSLIEKYIMEIAADLNATI